MERSARRAAVATYREIKPTAGVYAVRCAATEEIWVGRSANLAAQRNSLEFQLRHGPNNPAMRAAWLAHGADAFAFEILEAAPTTLTASGRTDFQKRRAEHWRATLGAAAIQMARARTNGLELEYDVLGKADAEPVLLIAGLGSQMTCWTAPFRALLVARGYRASDGFVAHGLNFARLIASPGHPFDAQARREQILADAERADDSAGFGRQLAAMATAGDIRPRLKGVSAPTLAVHGADDVLLPAAGGLDIVANVTGAGLRIIAGMGHDIPPELYEDIAAAIVENARRGTGKPGPDLHSRR